MHKIGVFSLSVLSERIDGLCAENGISGYRLCKDIGISPNVLTELRSERRNGLSAKNADKIASYFGVSVGYLLGTEDEKKAPAADTGDERKARLMYLLDQLPDDVLARELAYLEQQVRLLPGQGDQGGSDT